MPVVKAKSIYQENGYKDRASYIRALARNSGVSAKTAFMLADLLGPNEDFDGLVTELEDAADAGL